MWNPAHPTGRPEHEQPATSDAARKGEQIPRALAPVPVPYRAVSTYIGKSLLIKGEVSGSDPIEVDGRIEGPISLPNSHLNIRPDGVVMSDVQAAEVVVQGALEGKLAVSDRVKIQKGGSLVGEVTAVRVSIEDGAYLQANIDMFRPDPAAAFELTNVAATEQQPRAVDETPNGLQV